MCCRLHRILILVRQQLVVLCDSSSHCFHSNLKWHLKCRWNTFQSEIVSHVTYRCIVFVSFILISSVLVLSAALLIVHYSRSSMPMPVRRLLIRHAGLHSVASVTLFYCYRTLLYSIVVFFCAVFLHDVFVDKTWVRWQTTNHCSKYVFRKALQESWIYRFVQNLLCLSN